MTNELDAIDVAIVRLLQKDGRLPNTEIAKQVKISETTVRKRLQRLINEEYIHVVAVGNPFKLSRGISGCINIESDMKKINQVMSALNQIEELWYVARMEGEADINVEFFVQSMDHYRVLIDSIKNIDGVMQTNSSFIIQISKCRFDYMF